MHTFLDSLPEFPTADLPVVFNLPSDAARTDGKLKQGIRRCKVNVSRQLFRNARRESAAAAIIDRLPLPGEALHIVLDGSFDLHHLVGRIIQLADEPAETLDLATLGFHQGTVDALCELSDTGKVKHIRMVCSHYFRSVDVELFTRAHGELTSRGHTLFVCRNHAKLQCYRFASGRSVTLLSSANLRSCKNAEAAVLFCDGDTFNFWTSIIDELVKESEKCTQK